MSYNRNTDEARLEWENIMFTESIDFVLVWGTEYSHAIPALEAAKSLNIPSVIYIQGIMKAIARFADGLIPYKKNVALYNTKGHISRSDVGKTKQMVR